MKNNYERDKTIQNLTGNKLCVDKTIYCYNI